MRSINITHLKCLLIIGIVIIVAAVSLLSQDTREFAVEATAKVEKSPKPRITLKWRDLKFAKGYDIRRKEKDYDFWSNVIAKLDSGVTSWSDSTVVAGKIYEYQIRSISETNNTIQGYTGLFKWAATGYVASGIEVPEEAAFYKVLLIVDQKVSDSLPNEIQRLENDLVTEGWQVVKAIVPRAVKFDSAGVKAVKKIIFDEYNKQPNNLKTVFLLGRIPVPYSGRITPDGHVKGAGDHTGAWAADVYYAALYDNWTDISIFDTTAGRIENRNVPGDGKFDQSWITEADIEVGRVDLYNLPAFKSTEIQLIKNYLNRNHDYRTGNLSLKWHGVVDDNFQAANFSFMEGFATSGYRTWGTFFGGDSVRPADFITNLGVDNYLGAYGTGGGSWASCGGVGTTNDFAANKIDGVFSMLFGSFFGDWDVQNNILRAPLASNPGILTCCWAGRPAWYFHHLTMGENIGYSARITQNNDNLYEPFYWYNWRGNQWIWPNGYSIRFSEPFQKMVHIALMGDPTLRLYHPNNLMPKNLSVIQPPGGKIEIKWDNADDINVTYNVYRKNSQTGQFIKLNKSPINGSFFTDSNLYEGTLYYMVKSVKLTETSTGSFYNTSRGIIQSAVVTGVDDFTTHGNSVGCSPNPAFSTVNIALSTSSSEKVTIDIFTYTGFAVKTLFTGELAAGVHNLAWNLTDCNGSRVPAGVYLIKVAGGNNVVCQKIIVMP